MALTEINSKSIKDGEIVNADINASADIAGSKLADDTIAEAKLDVSNAPSDGKFLKYKDSTDKLTWDDVPAGVGGATGVDFNDDIKARFGTGNDLSIYHSTADGSNNRTYIENTKNDLVLKTTGTDADDVGVESKHDFWVSTNFDSGSPTLSLLCNNNAEVSLYHAGTKKFDTTATGIAVTGTVAATAVTGDGSGLTGIDAGATGGGTEKIFWENGTTIDTDYTVGTSFGAACNAMSAGPITINTGKTVTVDAGDTWTIV